METKKDLIKRMIFDLENYELIYIFKRKLDLLNKDDLQMRTRAANYIEKNCSDKDIDFFQKRMKKLLRMHMHSGRDYREGMINALLIKLNDDDPFTYVNAANNLLGCGELKDADENYSKALDLMLKKDPIKDWSIPELIKDHCICLGYMGNYDKAVEICKGLIAACELREVGPELKKKILLSAFRELAEALLRSCRLEEGLGALTKAYFIDPSDEGTKVVLANYFSKIQDHEKTIKICGEILKKNPRQNEALFYLGMALIFNGKKEEGKRELIKAYQVNPDDLAAKHNIINCIYELGRLDVPAHCDDWDYIDELAGSVEGDKMIQKEIERDKIRMNLEEMLEEE